MTEIAKRRIDQSWRDAVADRVGPAEAEPCRAEYDRLRRDGAGEAEAAFRVLAARGRLWAVDEPIEARPPADEIPPI